MPILVAGKGGGAFNPGRHVRFTNQPSVGNLFVSMLNALGAPVTQFRDSSGPLTGV